MDFEIIAELLLGLFANGIRFYAIKRYIDFFVSKEKCRWKNSWVLYVLACLGTYAVNGMFVSPGWNVVSNILAIFFILFPYRMILLKKTLMVLIIYAINALVDVIIVLLLTQYIPGQPIKAVYQLIISLILLIPTAILKRPDDGEKEVALPLMKGVIMGMVPIISVVCIYRIVILKGTSRTINLTVALCLIFINGFLFYLYHALVKFYAAQMNEKKLEHLVEIYKNELNVMSESQKLIKKLRHDMKHHMIELSAMAQQHGNEDIVQYLSEMEKFMLNPAEKVSTGNKEIDGIVNYMLRRADEALNIVELDIQIPKQMYTKNFKICVILGNLVDNAVREACKSDEKYLSISMSTQKDVLLILIENSYTGTIVKKDGKLLTSQMETSIHGLGLESVKQVVASCGGDMKIEYSDRRFQVQVLLYLSNIV